MVENYGDSALAEKFGVTRYPAIFIDEVLVAKPKDFGFYGQGEGKNEGRYAPWKDVKSHEKFRQDLERMLDLVLAGKTAEVRAEVGGGTAEVEKFEPPRLPEFTVAGFDGKELRAADLRGKVVLVEFWATWCPPCRGTLQWLGELKKRYGDGLEVVAFATESDPANVEKLIAQLNLPLRWAPGSPELARSFGDISAVPTLFLFDSEGKTRQLYLGAPPDLHSEVEAELEKLLKKRDG